MMKTLKILSLFFIISILLFCFNLQVHAQSELPEPGAASLVGLSGYLSTATANLSTLSFSKYQTNEVLFDLSSGDKIGGLLFKGTDSSSILICSFGFLADRWGYTAAQFVNSYVHTNQIESDVLILDDISSAGFFAENGTLGMGGLDQGHLFLELSRHLKRDGKYNRVTLLGVSLAGNGVVNALAEQERIQEKIIDSAITFSAVSNITMIPGWQLSRVSKEGAWGSKLGKYKAGLTKFGLKLWTNRFEKIMVRKGDNSFKVKANVIGDFFHAEFTKRVQILFDRNKNDSKLYEGKEVLESLESYTLNSNLSQHIRKIKTPLIMVHAADDPTVPFAHFQELQFLAGDKNSVVQFVAVPHGGHWGFTPTYGASWVAKIIKQAQSPIILKQNNKQGEVL